MKKKISVLLAGTAVGVLAAVGSAGPASAGHCVSPEGDSPGFSYFGTDHVQESTHPEGQAEKHSPGASNCKVTPGKNAAAGQK